MNTSEYTKATMYGDQNGGQTHSLAKRIGGVHGFDNKRSDHRSRAHSSAQGMGPLL